jgi:hypothetical protein
MRVGVQMESRNEDGAWWVYSRYILPEFKRVAGPFKSKSEAQKFINTPEKEGGAVNAWLAHVKEYRTHHPDLTYKEALKAASKSYQGKKEATKFLKEKGSETKKHQSLREKLRQCEAEKEQLKKSGVTTKTTSTIPVNINNLSLIEQIQKIIDHPTESEQILHQINPKRRAQIRSIIGKAKREAELTGMIGAYEPVLNKVTGKYEIDPARSKKQTKGFKNQKEHDEYITKRMFELAHEAESRPVFDFTKLKKK